MSAMLYLVPTPIGNLGDISLRCRETLENADFIAAEDTRVTLKLLNHLGIKKSLVSYYEHNKATQGSRIVERILAGETCALVSDAGSPAIPGPCAAITALSISGQATGRFCFEGFLSTAKKSRREHLDALKKEQRTMIFYEAPHKLLTTLTDMVEVFGGDRPISLCRELTKLHEEVVRTTLGEAVARYSEAPPKGEFVLIVAGAAEETREVPSDTDAAARVAQLMTEGVSRKDAVKQTAKELGLSKNAVYDIALKDAEEINS